MKGVVRILMLIAAVTVIVGCAGMSDVKHGLDTGEGIAQVVNCSESQARQIAMDVLNAHFKHVSDDNGRIFAKTVDTVFGLTFEPLAANLTRITAVSKRTL